MTYSEWAAELEEATQSRSWEMVTHLLDDYPAFTHAQTMQDVLAELTDIERWFCDEGYDDIALCLRTALNEIEFAIELAKRP